MLLLKSRSMNSAWYECRNKSARREGGNWHPLVCRLLVGIKKFEHFDDIFSVPVPSIRPWGSVAPGASTRRISTGGQLSFWNMSIGKHQYVTEETKRGEFFSEKNGHWLAIKPGYNLHIMKPTDHESNIARSAVERWMDKGKISYPELENSGKLDRTLQNQRSNMRQPEYRSVRLDPSFLRYDWSWWS